MGVYLYHTIYKRWRWSWRIGHWVRWNFEELFHAASRESGASVHSWKYFDLFILIQMVVSLSCSCWKLNAQANESLSLSQSICFFLFLFQMCCSTWMLNLLSLLLANVRWVINAKICMDHMPYILGGPEFASFFPGCGMINWKWYPLMNGVWKVL